MRGDYDRFAAAGHSAMSAKAEASANVKASANVEASGNVEASANVETGAKVEAPGFSPATRQVRAKWAFRPGEKPVSHPLFQFPRVNRNLVERTFRFASSRLFNLRAGFSRRHAFRPPEGGLIMGERAGREVEASLYRAPSPRPRSFGGPLYHLAIALLFLLLTAGCGYHTAGAAVRLPSDLHTIYVPAIVNNSQAYRVGTTLTEAVVRELRERTNYRIITTNDGSADATLSGRLTNVFVFPLTFDPVTDNVSSSEVAIGISATLTSKSGTVLWNNPNLFYREQYQESTDNRTFFEETTPAVQRIANSFAKTLVANMLEAF